MTEHVLTILAQRRAELAGEAATLHARLAAIATDTGHLDAVIRQFDPEYKIASIRPRRPRGPDVANRGETSRFILGVLRDATEPVTVATITQRLIAERGMNGQDRAVVRQIAKRVATTLRHQEKRGAVRAEQEAGPAVVWEAVR